MLAHWNTSSRIEMSPHSDTLSWFRANQRCSFSLVLRAYLRSNKYQFHSYWFLPDRGSNPFMQVYQWFFHWTLNPQFWEKSQPVPGAPKQSCSALQNFSWRPCIWCTCSQRFLNYSVFQSFDIERRTWWRLLQKHVMHTNLDIYVAINI